MADLSVWKWEKFVPDIGENRKLERPFFFLLKSGVSKLEMRAFLDRLATLKESEDPIESVAAALSDMVRLGDEPLKLGGQAVGSIQDYLRVLSDHLSLQPYLELVDAVQDFNSMEGTKSLFYARPSGGTGSTPSRATARAGSPTAAPSSGSATNH